MKQGRFCPPARASLAARGPRSQARCQGVEQLAPRWEGSSSPPASESPRSAPSGEGRGEGQSCNHSLKPPGVPAGGTGCAFPGSPTSSLCLQQGRLLSVTLRGRGPPAGRDLEEAVGRNRTGSALGQRTRTRGGREVAVCPAPQLLVRKSLSL